MSKAIGNNLPNVNSPSVTRLKQLAGKLDRSAFRHNYMSRHVRSFLAAQIRALRGDLSQSQFGKNIGKPQSVISRLEDEGYGKVTIRTLLDIAEKMNVALVVRFVDYPTFLRLAGELSEEVLNPEKYDKKAIEKYVQETEEKARVQQVRAMFTIEDGPITAITESGDREIRGRPQKDKQGSSLRFTLQYA